MFPERSPGSGASDWSRPERPKARKSAHEDESTLPSPRESPVNPACHIALNLTTAAVTAQQDRSHKITLGGHNRLKSCYMGV